MCTFTIPGVFPDGLSAVFPFINVEPPSGRGQHVFARDALAGVPIELYTPSSGRAGFAIFLFVVIGLLACVILVGRRYWLSNMANAAQRLRGYLEKEKRVTEQRLPKYTDEEQA